MTASIVTRSLPVVPKLSRVVSAESSETRGALLDRYSGGLIVDYSPFCIKAAVDDCEVVSELRTRHIVVGAIPWFSRFQE